MPRLPHNRSLFRFPWRTGRRIHDDVDEELRFHLDMRAKELVDKGIDPHAAEQTARHQFGDLEYTRVYCRELDMQQERVSRVTEMLDAFVQDVRYAVRTLKKAPAFTLVAVLTLALGIGANTAIFSVVYGVLLKPLPFAEPHRLVRVLMTDPGGGNPPLSALDFQDFRNTSKSVSALGAVSTNPTTLTASGGEPEQLERASVTRAFLPMLGVQPLVGGHLPAVDEMGPGVNQVMISERLWRRRFSADDHIVGRTILLDGNSSMIVGVVPDAQLFPTTSDIWSPLRLPAEIYTPPLRIARFLRVYGRLAPGASVAGARAELSTIAKRLAATYPNTNADLGAEVKGLQEYLVGDLRKPFLILLGAVGLVLLIACANVANLLLVRAAGRETELAIRTAMGASRVRVVRQLVTESVLLSLVGATVGLALAVWGTGQLATLARNRIPRLDAVRIDATVLAMTAIVAIGTGILFGVIPAWQTSRSDPARALKEGGRTGRMAGTRRVRRALIVAQTALSLVLLASAGLLLRSFGALRSVDPGFNTDGVATFDLSLRRRIPGMDVSEYRRQFAQAMLERVRALPGVRSAGVTSGLPLAGSFILNFSIVGRVELANKLAAEIRGVTPDYFTAMGIRAVSGRMPSPEDRNGAPAVAVINEAFAREFFGGANPLGQRVRVPENAPEAEIVGVVGNVKQYGLGIAPTPELYRVFAQVPSGDFSVVIRTAGQPRAVLAEAAGIVHSLDANLAVRQPRMLSDVVAESAAQPRMYVVLLGLFATAALALAAVGLYGVVSYSVTQRMHEMGVRMALGATAADIVSLVLREGALLTGAGLVLGLLGALWSTRLLARMIDLYGVRPSDPVALVGGSAVLVVAGLIACCIPARRAAGADPAKSLREV